MMHFGASKQDGSLNTKCFEDGCPSPTKAEELVTEEGLNFLHNTIDKYEVFVFHLAKAVTTA